jgi:cell wall assembly regulator SMI1
MAWMSQPPVWDVERMRVLAADWDKALRAEVPAYARLLPEVEARGSVLRPPATTDEVAAAEERLGVRLPASYRSFLLVANGADAAGSGAGYVLRGVSAAEEEQILSVEDVVAFADDEHLAWLVDMWRGNFESVADRQQLPGDEPVDVYDFEPGLRALLVTAAIQHGTVGLVPTGGEEWQVWQFFHSDVVAHRSFADFLSYCTRRARGRVADRAERMRVLDFGHLAFGDVELLAAHGDPRAVEAAGKFLLAPGASGPWKVEFALTLGRIGDPTAIPMLRAALPQVHEPGFAPPPEGVMPPAGDEARQRLTFTLMHALDLCGDTEVLRDLERLAQQQSPVAESAARYLATRDERPRW